MNWISNQADDFTLTQIIRVLAEHVYLIWFGCYSVSSAQGAQKVLACPSPFWGKNFEYLGTNFASPIRTNVACAENGTVALDLHEINARNAEVARERREEWTPQKHAASQACSRSYHVNVANPIRHFKAKAKRRGMRKSEIDRKVKAFQKAAKQAREEGGPPVDPTSILTL